MKAMHYFSDRACVNETRLLQCLRLTGMQRKCLGISYLYASVVPPYQYGRTVVPDRFFPDNFSFCVTADVYADSINFFCHYGLSLIAISATFVQFYMF